MKQTSIEWLFEQIPLEWTTKRSAFEALQQAKEMHKEEIIDAHIEGQRVFDKYDHTQWTTDQAEQYYQETFKKFTLMDETPSAPASDSTVMLPQQEISDEEIEKASRYIQTTNPDLWTFKIAWKAGARWYREQLKQRQ